MKKALVAIFLVLLGLPVLASNTGQIVEPDRSITIKASFDPAVITAGNWGRLTLSARDSDRKVVSGLEFSVTGPDGFRTRPFRSMSGTDKEGHFSIDCFIPGPTLNGTHFPIKVCYKDQELMTIMVSVSTLSPDLDLVWNGTVSGSTSESGANGQVSAAGITDAASCGSAATGKLNVTGSEIGAWVWATSVPDTSDPEYKGSVGAGSSSAAETLTGVLLYHGTSTLYPTKVMGVKFADPSVSVEALALGGASCSASVSAQSSIPGGRALAKSVKGADPKVSDQDSAHEEEATYLSGSPGQSISVGCASTALCSHNTGSGSLVVGGGGSVKPRVWVYPYSVPAVE